MYGYTVYGSGRVVVDENKKGFSIAKGIVGTALVGTGGVVMGINGNYIITKLIVDKI